MTKEEILEELRALHQSLYEVEGKIVSLSYYIENDLSMPVKAVPVDEDFQSFIDLGF